MAHRAKSLVFLVASVSAACAASGPDGPSTPIDVDRACLAAQWRQAADATTVAVAATNRCGRPLTCDIDLTLATLGGPELILDCADRAVPDGRTETLCRWDGQPAVTGGTGAARCR